MGVRRFIIFGFDIFFDYIYLSSYKFLNTNPDLNSYHINIHKTQVFQKYLF